MLALAVSQSRALITLHRRDFIRLHRQQPQHHGSIVCTEDADIEGQALRIDAALRAVATLEGQLIRVYRPG